MGYRSDSIAISRDMGPLRFANGWFPKRWFWRMFPGTKNRNEGTCGCSPVPKAGTRAHSPKSPFYETAPWWTFRPRKKIFSPPPPQFPTSPQTPSRPLGPSPSWRPPPSGISNKRSTPPLAPRTPPSPSPSRKKKIRNVHQGPLVSSREKTPGLILLVLTVLVFWFQVLLMPGSQASSRSLRVCH